MAEKKTPMKRTNMFLPGVQTKEMDKLAQWITKETGVNITKSELYRRGGKLILEQYGKS